MNKKVFKKVVRRSGCEIITADCRDWLATYSGPQFDLVMADPPFNFDRPYGVWNDNLPAHDFQQFTREWIVACDAHLRPGGAFWVNIPDELVMDVHIQLSSLRYERINWCLWHYRFGQNTEGRFIRSHTHALYFVKPGGRRTWNPKAVLEDSDRASKYNDKRTFEKKSGENGKRVPLDVWSGEGFARVQGNNAERRSSHDNQLPEVYLERVIRSCSNPGDLVLDPFVGSGTTPVVARVLGRRFVGTEIDPAHAESARERVRLGAVRVKNV